MCPEFERVERIVQKMVDKSEKANSALLPTSGFSIYHDKLTFKFLVSASIIESTPKHGNKDVEAISTFSCRLRRAVTF